MLPTPAPSVVVEGAATEQPRPRSSPDFRVAAALVAAHHWRALGAPGQACPELGEGPGGYTDGPSGQWTSSQSWCGVSVLEHE